MSSRLLSFCWSLMIVCVCLLGLFACKAGNKQRPDSLPQPPKVTYLSIYDVCTTCRFKKDILEFEKARNAVQIEMDCPEFGILFHFDQPYANRMDHCYFTGSNSHESDSHLFFIRSDPDRSSPNVLTVYDLNNLNRPDSEEWLMGLHHKYYFYDPILNCRGLDSAKMENENIDLEYWTGLAKSVRDTLHSDWIQNGTSPSFPDTIYKKESQFHLLNYSPYRELLYIISRAEINKLGRSCPAYRIKLDLTAHKLLFDKKEAIKIVCPDSQDEVREAVPANFALYLNYSACINFKE